MRSIYSSLVIMFENKSYWCQASRLKRISFLLVLPITKNEDIHYLLLETLMVKESYKPIGEEHFFDRFLCIKLRKRLLMQQKSTNFHFVNQFQFHYQALIQTFYASSSHTLSPFMKIMQSSIFMQNTQKRDFWPISDAYPSFQNRL